jgi:hypothetical protein
MNAPYFLLAAALVALVSGTAAAGNWPDGETPIHPNLRYYEPVKGGASPEGMEADICVYGGTSAGVMAAVQGARDGLRVVLVAPESHLGGLTTGGLTWTDFGNKGSIGGISREFYSRVGKKYGVEAEWTFEPKVAEEVFNEMAAEAKVPVRFRHFLKSVRMEGRRIRSLTTERGLTVEARMFIDATYEGDLMAKAGVSYTVGREANAQYGETLNGCQIKNKHQFDFAVSPYVEEHNPASGLLPGIESGPVESAGTGDRRVQAYNFRMTLTQEPSNRIPFPKPKGYDPREYELLARYLQHDWQWVFGKFDPLRGSKVDKNNHGAISTDFIGRNYRWPEADYRTRERIFREHVVYQQGLMWFLSNDPRVPEECRNRMASWGLCKDEFTDTGGWPRQLYVREARRMVSDYVLTEQNCRGTRKAEDSVGLGSYGMDSHNVRRVVVDGAVKNEGDVQVGGFSPYPISYRSIVPKRGECENLLVPVCVSTSHIAYGSVRMEPVFMLLAQSASAAAAQAIKRDGIVQNVEYGTLRARLLELGQVIDWTPERAAESDSAGIPSIPNSSLPGIVLDDSEGKKTGQWSRSIRSAERKVGNGYVHDSNMDKGKSTIEFSPKVSHAGEYELILIAPSNPNRATNVPVMIGSALGKLRAVVNLRSEEGKRFHSVGRFRFEAGEPVTILISNENTDGYVVVDGIQLLPVSQ